MTLKPTEFAGLAMEVQSEYLYFLSSYQEISHEINGVEMGLKRIAPYKIYGETCEMSAMDRLRAKDAWVQKELETHERYQRLLENKVKYEERLDRIVSSVRESK